MKPKQKRKVKMNEMNATSEKKVSNYGFFEIGKWYFIRTVTHHQVGELVGFDRDGLELIFKNAHWVADDGRFGDMWKRGTFAESEPFPSGLPILVNRESIIDAGEWTHQTVK
jgi:hypothetical protein